MKKSLKKIQWCGLQYIKFDLFHAIGPVSTPNAYSRHYYMFRSYVRIVITIIPIY